MKFIAASFLGFAALMTVCIAASMPFTHMHTHHIESNDSVRGIDRCTAMGLRDIPGVVCSYGR